MEKKKNLLLKKLAVVFAAAFLVVQLVSCGDDDPLKGGNNNGGNNTPQPGQIDKLKDASQPVSGYFSISDLNALDTTAALGTKVDDLGASLSVSAASGRAGSTTRLVVVIAQDMFGNDLSGKLVEVTKPLADKNNVVAVIGGKISGTNVSKFKTHLDPTKIKSNVDVDGTLTAVAPEVNSYATLHAAASKLFKVTRAGTPTKAYTYTIKFGKLVNEDQKDLYSEARTKLVAIIQSLAATAGQMHANKEDIALVALDPFMSTLVVDIAGDATVNKTGSKITTVAALAPIMKFSSEGTDAAVNISYAAAGNVLTLSNDSLKAHLDFPEDADTAKIKLKDSIAVKQAFNALRVSGVQDKSKSFFASLVNGSKEHDLGTKHVSNKIANVVFHIAGTEKLATATNPTLATGENLILQDNADKTGVGLVAIVNPATNVKVTSLTKDAMGGDANFPAPTKLADLFKAAPFADVLKK